MTSSFDNGISQKQYQSVCNDRDELQATVNALIKDNDALRKSVYHLSYLLSNQASTANVATTLASQFKHDSMSSSSSKGNASTNSNSDSTIPYSSNTDSSGSRSTPMNGKSSKYHAKQESNSSNDDGNDETDYHDNNIDSYDSATLYNSKSNALDGNDNDDDRKLSDDGRYMNIETSIQAHTGAIYCGEFSHSGRWFATGSVDKSIKVWDCRNFNRAAITLIGHSNIVSSIAWDKTHTTIDSSTKRKVLYSTSYDKHVKIWDINNAKCTQSYTLKSLGTIIKTLSQSNEYAGGCAVCVTSSTEVAVVDPRYAKIAQLFEHTCIPTAMCCDDDKHCVIVGDAVGAISVYDIRMLGKGTQLDYLNDSAVTANGGISSSSSSSSSSSTFHGNSYSKFRITDIQITSTQAETSLLSLQCSDNCIRLVDLLWSGKANKSDAHITSTISKVDDVSTAADTSECMHEVQPPCIIPVELRFNCAIRGHVSGSNEMKTSFYKGLHYKYHINTPASSISALTKVNLSSSVANAIHTGESNSGTSGTAVENELIDLDDYGGFSSRDITPKRSHSYSLTSDEVDTSDRIEWEDSLLLATGSIDGSIHIHDLTTQENKLSNIQTIRNAHNGAVYGVAYAPTTQSTANPNFLSYGADGNLKVWSSTHAKSRIKRVGFI